MLVARLLLLVLLLLLVAAFNPVCPSLSLHHEVKPYLPTAHRSQSRASTQPAHICPPLVCNMNNCKEVAQLLVCYTSTTHGSGFALLSSPSSVAIGPRRLLTGGGGWITAPDWSITQEKQSAGLLIKGLTGCNNVGFYKTHETNK